MKRYIYLFRHGQSFYNKSGRFTGHINSGLTERGKRDAKKIAIVLKNEKIDVAYQTKLSRSKDTLRAVLKFHPECKKIKEDNRMIERDYGKLSGKYHKTIIIELGKEQYDIWHRSYDVAPPKGESMKMVEVRVNAFIKDLLKFVKKNKVNVAISAHGNSMRPFRRYFEKFGIEKMLKLENPYDKCFRYSLDV
ncbi:MAG: 2,3-bisphosphoglycerate-dependent phosphoglycerate mutase [Nanoarchaeota archaeon]|nr:2,3-bisphosphoglycerate-dependent phosphoglycerate mutase [Nanoarchaeota archaeon]|tara:strand:- start:837 stop:1412 length:576 start_codon:yes stop_codon:yes gene_type:complete